ncbi:MAG TPA: hypothetical protein VER03_06620 [Bryobacteraceae bacterium]|nr:hypothetical protein [Bryobacteraceae bacterium]
MRVFLLAIALAASIEAQAPVRLPGSCSVELVQQLDLSCSPEEPCPLYLEINDVELVGERMMAAGNVNTPSATLQSLLLLSDDAGKTWTEAHTRIPGAALTSIQFIDFEVGWISGHVLHPDARDPFFLITSDGGKTWRRRAVYSEPKSGAVEFFRFDSRTSGRMAVDRGRAGENGLRYELWESMTGGDSWSIRQVDSRAIPFPGGDAPRTKPVRVRTDAASKSYKVERQDATQWRSLASFAVAMGQCKPEVSEPKEEPEQPPAAAPPDSPAPTSKPNAPPPTLRRGGGRSQ